jgi:hypothetical protein
MEAGAGQFVVTSFVPDPRAFMRRWMREVAPAVAGRDAGAPGPPRP